jgi:hypothetical protein
LAASRLHLEARINKVKVVQARLLHYEWLRFVSLLSPPEDTFSSTGADPMPYMVQTMSSAALPVIKYYRKQTTSHPSHVETGKFTTDATAAYAATNGIATSAVVPGHFFSGQNKPSNATNI